MERDRCRTLAVRGQALGPTTVKRSISWGAASTDRCSAAPMRRRAHTKPASLAARSTWTWMTGAHAFAGVPPTWEPLHLKRSADLATYSNRESRSRDQPSHSTALGPSQSTKFETVSDLRRSSVAIPRRVSRTIGCNRVCCGAAFRARLSAFSEFAGSPASRKARAVSCQWWPARGAAIDFGRRSVEP